MAEVQSKVRRTVRYSEVIQVTEGEEQVVINLPEPVPVGKVLNLRIEIAGSYANPQAPVVEDEPVP
jgi:hypothetical protein